LRIAIRESVFRPAGAPPVPVTVLTGNVHHELTPIAQEDRLLEMEKILDQWKNDLTLVTDFVQNYIVSSDKA
jgi:hypothetical protein